MWTLITCDNCRGYGVVSVYSRDDFEGAGECSRCGGSGNIWKSPKGRLAEYPGGRFLGSASKSSAFALESDKMTL